MLCGKGRGEVLPFPEVRGRKLQEKYSKLWKCQQCGHFMFELVVYLADSMNRVWSNEGQPATVCQDHFLQFMVIKKYGRWFLSGLKMPELGTREGRCDYEL